MIYIDNLRHFRVVMLMLPKHRSLFNIYTETPKKNGYKPFVSILYTNGVPWIHCDPDTFFLDTDFKPELLDRFRRIALTDKGDGISKIQMLNDATLTNISQSYEKPMYDCDMEFIRAMSQYSTRRVSQYTTDTDEYPRLTEYLKSRGINLQLAQNLYIVNPDERVEESDSTITFLLSIPLHGFMLPIMKDKHYKVINGALMMTNTFKGMLDFESALCDYYSMENFLDDAGNSWCAPNCNKVCYLLLDTDGAAPFQMTETLVNKDWLINNPGYGKVINHSFTLMPDSVLVDLLPKMNNVHLRHIASRGIIPITAATERYFSRNKEKLFYLSDIPSWVQVKGETTEYTIP